MKITVDTKKQILLFDGKNYPCAIGKNGVIPERDGREGDGKTPLGTYGIRYGFYRSDRIELAASNLQFWPLRQEDGWCDAPDDPAYNCPIRLPYPASAEKLWREDHIYDVIIVLGHNDSPPVPNMGSAIFLHIAREGYTPTEGCVAISHMDILNLVKALSGDDVVIIG